MAEIPDDVMERARDLCGDNHCHAAGRLAAAQDSAEPCDHCERIARALMAERERCADVAIGIVGAGLPDSTYGAARAAWRAAMGLP